jgi:hypothetical protein
MTDPPMSRFHVFLFASFLLDTSIKYLIQNSLASTNGPEVLPDDLGKAHSLLLARWTISASLFATLLLMTLKSFLNRSLDRPGTLFINNRYLRMAPRAMVGIAVMCLSIVKYINTVTFLGIILALLQFLILWETVAAMEKGFQWFEPKDADAQV